MGRAAGRMAVVLLVYPLLLGCAAHGEFEEAAGARTLKQEVAHNHEVHCSRERSRAAWKIIEEYLMPFVGKEQYQISTKCRLHPDNDMFREQEQHKIHVDINEWRCGFCKKSFRAEKFLDQHFDNRHYNLLNNTRGRCLADLCGALHCDQVTETKKTKTKCNPAAAARNHHLCEGNTCVLYERHGYYMKHYIFDISVWEGAWMMMMILIVKCRALQIVVFLSIKVLQQAVFMNSFYVNFVMPTHARELENLSLEGAESNRVCSTLPFVY